MRQKTNFIQKNNAEPIELAHKIALWEEKGLLDKMMADIDEALAE